MQTSWTSAQRRALLIFAVIATAFPWTGWALLMAFGWGHAWSMPLFVASGAFCSIAGVIAICMLKGWREGLNEIGQNLLPRGGPWPWMMALLWGPVWIFLAQVGYALWNGTALDPKWDELSRYFTSGILFLWLTGPLGEEFGWRGFLFPLLLKRWSFARSAVIVGVLWALWHTPLMYQRWMGDPLHLPYFVTMVTVFSFMMGWVSLRGGLLPTLLLHWSINASQEVVPHVFGATTQPDKGMWLMLTVTLLLLVGLGWRIGKASHHDEISR